MIVLEMGADMDPASHHAQPALTSSPCCCHAEHLGERMLEVICHVAEGLPNSEIAEKMHMSQHTVAGYVQAACERLGARNRTDLAVRACVAGLVALAWPPRPTGRRCLHPL